MTGADAIGPGVDGAVISADSHVTEPPEAYADIDPRFADRAPTLVHLDGMGATMLTDPGSPHQGRVPFSMIAGAGVPADELGFSQGKRWEELHHGGYDAAARLLEQDRDGIAAEVLYPSVGMLLCNHPDFDYKQACFDAYNRWLAAWCAHAPDRLWGVGQSAMRSPEDGIADLASIRELGLRGVMLPGVPAGEDYDHPAYDEFWEAAVDVGLPISFHILTGGAGGLASDAYRGPKMNSFLGIIRGNQDLLGTLIFGGVFERHPRLRVVCVEADAGWAPHWMYRADHAYARHRNWLEVGTLSRLPSEYFREHVYLTFQDDWVAFGLVGDGPADEGGGHPVGLADDRLLWANDHPHSDSTWPDSQAMLTEHTAGMDPARRDRILRANTAGLYGC
ncbi:MAG TPA: amidohydrolase family protein [Acidimicrobiia bacterium]|nr:amidohydrolase family protein [Acidimicrobiia bacterium]